MVHVVQKTTTDPVSCWPKGEQQHFLWDNNYTLKK